MALRPITIWLQNDTGETLRDGAADMTHGKMTSDPPTSLPSGASGSFAASERSWASIGPEGTVKWKGSQSGGDYSVYFVHPFSTAETIVRGKAPATYSWKIENDQLQRQDASCTLEFYKENAGPALRVRHDQKTMSATDIARFVNAVKELKSRGVYDQFVLLHQLTLTYATVNWAHMSPVFLPWHRWFLNEFEKQLQAIDPFVTLPYWNWTVDRSTDPTVNHLFSDSFMGGNGDSADNQKVKTGPFTGSAGWVLIYNTYDRSTPLPGDLPAFFPGAATTGVPTSYLQRDLANTVAPTLPTAEQVELVLGMDTYDTTPWTTTEITFRDALEGWAVPVNPIWDPDNGLHMHNRVHMWVGGSMSTLGTSPNDPLFFLHHAYVDLLWARWMKAQSVKPGYQPYLPTGTGSLPGLGRDSFMPPWDDQSYPIRASIDKVAPAGVLVSPGDLLDTRTLGYTYDLLPESG
ncbi:MAG: hypothetical protein AUI14_26450 [Actinobacteria bacterium 13_2_20CM_2_71_6]|nr:MAG: hypothetical protein AUI14_26450 [Actinobacteria bacterium 13_2_20CM_2_71_6]